MKIRNESFEKTLRDMVFLEKQGDVFVPTYTRIDLTVALHDVFGL